MVEWPAEARRGGAAYLEHGEGEPVVDGQARVLGRLLVADAD